MEIIGIIAEYNPFHNGHRYHINKIKEMYPDSLIILVLNGYFLERGEISFLTKEEKTRIALENDIDIVVELPFAFGSESADTFAEASTLILNYLGVNRIIFGSESNDIKLLTDIAKKQLDTSFDEIVKENMKKGLNYPTALNKALNIDLNSPNDLLGISYIKSIIKNKLSIIPECIKRTSDYHNVVSNEDIISASNIRNKILNNENVSKYTNYYDLIKIPNYELLFEILKYKIIMEDNLSKYLTVDEGIEYKLKKEIINSNNIQDLIMKIKSKRYTYNRINRMLIHILMGFTKEERKELKIDYIKLLGFNKKGKEYLRKIKCIIPVTRKISNNFPTQQLELKAAQIYSLLTKVDVFKFEISNKPIIKN